MSWIPVGPIRWSTAPQYGWVCPVCTRVYAPTTPMCSTCGPHTMQQSEMATLAEQVREPHRTDRPPDTGYAAPDDAKAGGE